MASATIDALEHQRAEHEAWTQALEARDPGANLPLARAQTERQDQLAEIEQHTTELIRLDAAIEVREAHTQADAGLGARLRRAGLRKVATDAGDAEFLTELRDAMLEREREREAAARLRDLSDRRRRPAVAGARAIAAAALTSEQLHDDLRRRPREVVERSEFGVDVLSTSSDAILDVEDIGVLATVFGLLAERDPIDVSVEHGGTWPTWSRVPPTGRLMERLRHLAANRWLRVETGDGKARTVTFGERAIEIAREAGVEV